MNRNHKQLVGIVLLGMGLPAAVCAQDVDRRTTELTLEQATALARSNNPAYRQTVNNLQLNAIENREFWLAFLPQLNLTVLDTNMQWNRQTQGTDNFGNPIANPESRMIQSASSNLSARLGFSVDFADVYNRQVTRLRAEGREIDATRAGQDLASDVRVAFLDVQERRASRDLEERLITMQATNFEITQLLFSLAQVDGPDLLGAEINYLEQENLLEESGAALETALLRLRNLFAEPGLGAFEIIPAPLRIFDPALLDAEALVALAVGSGPAVRQQELGRELAAKSASISRTYWLPTVTLSARTGRQQFSQNSTDGFFQPIPDGDWSRNLSLRLSFPDVGSYFVRQTGARREELDVRNADFSLRQARLQVEEAVRGLILALNSQYRALDVQERRAGLAQERLQLEQERYRLGQSDYLALQSSVQTLSDAERQALQARYGFERALIDLERALGVPLVIPTGD